MCHLINVKEMFILYSIFSIPYFISNTLKKLILVSIRYNVYYISIYVQDVYMKVLIL